MSEAEVEQVLSAPDSEEQQLQGRVALRKRIDTRHFRVVYVDEGLERVIITAFEET